MKKFKLVSNVNLMTNYLVECKLRIDEHKEISAHFGWVNEDTKGDKLTVPV